MITIRKADARTEILDQRTLHGKAGTAQIVDLFALLLVQPRCMTAFVFLLR